MDIYSHTIATLNLCERKVTSIFCLNASFHLDKIEKKRIKTVKLSFGSELQRVNQRVQNTKIYCILVPREKYQEKSIPVNLSFLWISMVIQ